MMIHFGEDIGQCVLGTDGSSAKSIVERRGTGQIRHLYCLMCGFWRDTHRESCKSDQFSHSAKESSMSRIAGLLFFQRMMSWRRSVKCKWNWE